MWLNITLCIIGAWLVFLHYRIYTVITRHLLFEEFCCLTFGILAKGKDGFRKDFVEAIERRKRKSQLT